MQPATKHWLFFAFLLVSLALLVAVVTWSWWRAADATAGHADPPPRPAANETPRTLLNDGPPASKVNGSTAAEAHGRTSRH